VGPASRRGRLIELAAWPVFLFLVAVVVVMGLVVGTIVGPH
jgi:type II secretory pathway component PulF